MKVICLEPKPKDFPSVAAYAFARYSRSAKSLEEIQEDLLADPTGAAEKLSKIFNGYGHASVAGMAHEAVAIEGVSILDSLRFFYHCPYGDGQERSTRYQSRFIPHVTSAAPAEYLLLLNSALERYYKAIPLCEEALAKEFPPQDEEQRKSLKLRALDCARYLLPLGVQTSLGQIQSARSWRDYLTVLGAYKDSSSRALYALLKEELLQSGVRLLVKYCDPKVKPASGINPLNLGAYLARQELIVDYPTAEVAIIERLIALAKPEGHYEWRDHDPYVIEALGKHLVNWNHHEHSELFNAGNVRIRGYCDVGTLKDLNRHRSLEKFIPFLHEEYNLEVSLREPNYAKPPYASAAELKIFQLDEYYRQVRKFLESSHGLPPEEVSYWVKCLLPQAHKVAYHFHGTPADLSYTIQLRVRPGGHLSYRQEVYNWLKCLEQSSPLWTKLLESTPDPVETLSTFYSRG